MSLRFVLSGMLVLLAFASAPVAAGGGVDCLAAQSQAFEASGIVPMPVSGACGECWTPTGTPGFIEIVTPWVYICVSCVPPTSVVGLP